MCLREWKQSDGPNKVSIERIKAKFERRLDRETRVVKDRTKISDKEIKLIF